MREIQPRYTIRVDYYFVTYKFLFSRLIICWFFLFLLFDDVVMYNKQSGILVTISI